MDLRGTSGEAPPIQTSREAKGGRLVHTGRCAMNVPETSLKRVHSAVGLNAVDPGTRSGYA